MARKHDFDKYADIIDHEVQRDVPRVRTQLDLTADASNAAEQEMLGILRHNWANPDFRHDLLQREAPDRVLELLLKANDVRNPEDGRPMTVHQYTKQVLEPFIATGTSPFIAPPQPQMVMPPVPTPTEPLPTHPIIPTDTAPAAAPAPVAMPAPAAMEAPALA